MYKDKDKQREAVREATRRYRSKGITKVSQEQGITVIPKASDGSVTVIPKPTQRLKPEYTNIKPKAQSYNPMMVGYVPSA